MSASKAGERKKRIVFFVENLGGGGAEQVLLTYLRRLSRERYDIAVRAIVRAGRLIDSLPADIDFKALITPPKGDGLLSRAWFWAVYHAVFRVPRSWVHRLLRRGTQPDVEIAFLEGQTTRIIAAPPEDVPKVAWVHCDLLRFPWTLQHRVFKDAAAQAVAYKRFDRVVVVSRNAAAGFSEACGRDAMVIYNPVDHEKVVGGREVASRSESSPLRLVVVARLTGVKGVDRLLQAAARLRDEGEDFSLTVVGEGPDLEGLRRFVEEHALGQRVSFTGFLDDPHAVTAECDIMVCPSREEGFSLAIVEGMMLGLPVVATATSGPSEILDGGRWGILCENSVDGLVYGMRRMLSDPRLRARCRRLSLERSEAYSLDESLAAFDALIEETIAEKNTRNTRK